MKGWLSPAAVNGRRGCCAELVALPCCEAVRFKLDHLIGTLHFHFNSAATVQKADSPLLPKRSGTAAVD